MRVLMSFTGGDRKFKRLYEQLKEKGIEYKPTGALSLGSDAQGYIINEKDVDECKKLGMRKARKQWDWLSKE